MSETTIMPASLFLFVPDNLSIEALIVQYGHPIIQLKDEPYQHRDRLLYLVHLVSRHHKNGKHSDIFLNRCSELLRYMFRSYKKYITYLLVHGVIETDNTYSNLKGKKKKCLGYKLTKQYRNSPIKKVIIFDEEIVKKITKNTERATTKEAKEKYQKLYENFISLDFDDKEVNSILNKIYGNTEQESINRAQQVNLLQKVRNNTGSFKGGRTGRLYTPISNLKKELRQGLRVEGKRLVELDIKASIPTILEILLSKEGGKRFDRIIKKYRYRDKKEKENEYQQGLLKGQLEDKERKTVSNIEPCGREPYMWANFGGLLNKEDVLRFRKDIRTGDIYDIYMKEYNEVLDKEMTRGQIKMIVLSIINSPKYCKGAHRDLFKDMYPTVMRIINKLNGWFIISKNGVMNDDVAPIAYITQEIESDFVLGMVCKRIVSDKPDLPIFTIHDAVYTIEEHVEYVELIMKEESKGYYGTEIRISKTVL